MFKKIFAFFIFPFFISAQTPDPSLVFYEQGVNAFRVNAYALADSLFTKSISLKPHPDSYFNRAAVRYKIKDLQGYCEDLGYAGGMRDKEAHEQFRKDCGTTDTVFLNSKNETVPRSLDTYYNVIYKSRFFEAGLAAYYGIQNRLINFKWFQNRFCNGFHI